LTCLPLGRRYDITVAGPDARGGRGQRGLYLREPRDSEGPTVAAVTVTPRLHEDAANELVGGGRRWRGGGCVG
jgi:hypothetical protein